MDEEELKEYHRLQTEYKEHYNQTAPIYPESPSE
jgi:hypothetical protein